MVNKWIMLCFKGCDPWKFTHAPRDSHTSMHTQTVLIENRRGRGKKKTLNLLWKSHEGLRGQTGDWIASK